MKQLIAFDLDGTLAESKQPLGPDMAGVLADLLGVADVAIISGGDWPQFKKQVIAKLPRRADRSRLFIMPTTGTKLYRVHDERWRPVYADLFPPAERTAILTALNAALAKAGLADERIWGERVEDRGSQITFSGLGQEAPLAAKDAWDPDRKKRLALQKSLERALPDVSIKLGGSTSLDITRPGVDKAYAMRRLAKESGIATGDMLFFGDAIFPGGNDYAVAAAGMSAVKVRDPAETATAVRAIIALLS